MSLVSWQQAWHTGAWPFLLSQLALALLPAVILSIMARRHADLEVPTQEGLTGRSLRRLLLQFFALGALLALPATFLSIPMRVLADSFTTPWGEGLGRAFLSAAIPEELVKYVAMSVLLTTLLRRGYWRPTMPVGLGAAVGLGFALVENIFYLRFAADPVVALLLLFIRVLTALPCHVFLGSLMAYHLSVAVWSDSRTRRVGHHLAALLLPMLLHGLYDLPLLAQGSPAGPDPSSMLLALSVLVWLALWTRLKLGRLARLPIVGAAPLA